MCHLHKSVVINFMKDPMLIAELGTKLGIVLKHYKTINAKTLAISKSSRGFSISMARSPAVSADLENYKTKTKTQHVNFRSLRYSTVKENRK